MPITSAEKQEFDYHFYAAFKDLIPQLQKHRELLSATNVARQNRKYRVLYPGAGSLPALLPLVQQLNQIVDANYIEVIAVDVQDYFPEIQDIYTSSLISNTNFKRITFQSAKGSRHHLINKEKQSGLEIDVIFRRENILKFLSTVKNEVFDLVFFEHPLVDVSNAWTDLVCKKRGGGDYRAAFALLPQVVQENTVIIVQNYNPYEKNFSWDLLHASLKFKQIQQKTYWRSYFQMVTFPYQNGLFAQVAATHRDENKMVKKVYEIRSGDKVALAMCSSSLYFLFTAIPLTRGPSIGVEWFLSAGVLMLTVAQLFCSLGVGNEGKLRRFILFLTEGICWAMQFKDTRETLTTALGLR